VGAAYLEMPDFDGPADFLAALADAQPTGEFRDHAVRYPRRSGLPRPRGDPRTSAAEVCRFAALGQPVPAGRGGLDLLRGAILLQFPPWFPISRPGKEYILACAERAAPRRVCVEFRNRTWMTDENQKETLGFLSAHRLPYVCVDEPQGYSNSIPPVLAATSDLAVIRLHGHSDQWESHDIQERFRYRYDGGELATWAGNAKRLAADADETHVVFNNCYRDYAHVNAGQLAGLIS
jgi:uncharacterized protein YecE (DUF72 family)